MGSMDEDELALGAAPAAVVAVDDDDEGFGGARVTGGEARVATWPLDGAGVDFGDCTVKPAFAVTVVAAAAGDAAAAAAGFGGLGAMPSVDGRAGR